MYDAALKTSSQRTYKTGQNAYKRFLQLLPQTSAAVYPFRRRSISETELRLAFFMASLVLKPTISASSTILGYETHVKYLFRSEGCEPEQYATAFLSQIRVGIQKSFPRYGDKRTALILPRHLDAMNSEPVSMKKQKLRLATILGFIGMLRPHTFQQLGPRSFILVRKDERLIPLQSCGTSGPSLRRLYGEQHTFLGFYINFSSKTMPAAKAYFPNLA